MIVNEMEILKAKSRLDVTEIIGLEKEV